MNLAIFLPGWIGDVVMATPALRALRTHFRTAHLIGVMKPYVAGVLEGGDWFDEWLPANDGSWSRGILATAARLRRRQVDWAVLFPNSFRSALTAWLGGFRRRVGYARYGRSPLLTDSLDPVRDSAGRLVPSPVLDAYNRLAERVGCPPPGHRMELFTTATDERAADRIWERTGLHRCPEVVCLNPGAAFGSAKYWPAEYFAELARQLASRRGSGVLVLCGPTERELARSIAAEAAHPSIHSLADHGPLSLGLTKACVRRADLLITTDSGPRHFAAAFGRPVVTLFGPTHVAWTETHYGLAIHLQKKVECGPCQRRVCPLDHRCMKRLLPAEVFAAAERLLRKLKFTPPSADEGAA
jgi:heptosyltransferase-2